MDNARWYDPRIISFNKPDTLIPDPSNPLDYNRYAYTRYNPVRYTDPSGHYGKDVHEELTYNVVFNSAMGHAIKQGVGYLTALSFADTLATQISEANQSIDESLSESSLTRPGKHTTCAGPSGASCVTYTKETTPHWWTTPEAEDALQAAESPEEFGRALHGYQDSHAHWQKAGKLETPVQTRAAHTLNNWYKVAIAAEDKRKSFDYFDPSTSTIDRAMVTGQQRYINEYVREYWNDWSGYDTE